MVATRTGIKPAASGTKKMNVGKEMDQARDFFDMWKSKYSRKIANMGKDAQPLLPGCISR